MIVCKMIGFFFGFENTLLEIWPALELAGLENLRVPFNKRTNLGSTKKLWVAQYRLIRYAS